MTTQKTFNVYLPLPGDLHLMLREEAEDAGVPATALAREALADRLKQRSGARS